MGFAAGYKIGSDIAVKKQDSERKDRQEKLTALTQGYEIDPESGEFVPTVNKQKEQSIKEQQLDVTMKAMQEQIANTDAKNALTDMNDITLNMFEGNYEDAKVILNRNNSLKNKIASNMDVVDFAPIDFTNDTRLLESTGIMGIDKLDNPEVREALNATFFKAMDSEGNWSIRSSDALAKETNLWNNLDSKGQDRYTKQARHINAILKGAGITLEEEEAGETVTAAAQAEAEAGISTSELVEQKATMMSEAIATGDPKEVTRTFMLTNPEQFVGSKGRTRRDSLEQAVTAFTASNPDATDEETQQFYNNFLQKTFEGVGSVREESDIAQLSGVQKEAVDSEGKSDDEVRDIESRIFAKLDEKKKASAMKDIDRMKANFNTSSNLSRILEEGGDKIDKDIIADLNTWTNKKLGSETQQTLDNVDFNTRSGLLLANFIKEISGTAASQPEIDRLKDILLGGNLTDEIYVRQAIRTFSDELVLQTKQLAGNLKDTAPHSIRKYTKQQDKQAPSAADFD